MDGWVLLDGLKGWLIYYVLGLWRVGGFNFRGFDEMAFAWRDDIG